MAIVNLGSRLRILSGWSGLFIAFTLLVTAMLGIVVVRQAAPGLNDKTPELAGATTAAVEEPVRVAKVESPISESASAWTRDWLAIALFEQLSTSVEIVIIDRASGATKSITVPESYVVYSMFFDRTERDVLWVATSQKAALWRIRVDQGKVERVAEFGAEKFVFASEQHPSGDVYVGIYPDAQIFRVSMERGAYIQRVVTIDPGAIGARTNVKDIFIPDTGLVFFHVGSPGGLIGYDPGSGTSAEVLRSTEPFLFPIRDVPAVVEKISSSAEFVMHPLRDAQAPADQLPPWAGKLLPRTVYKIRENGFELVVAHDGKETRLSARPRQGGMPIVAFARIDDRTAIGSTYWNRWFFRFDLTTGKAEPLGPIGRTGEFFAACPYGDGAAIPHYLGLLLVWNPAAPMVPPRSVFNPSDPREIARGKEDNPREILVLPDGHLGLSCVELGPGRLVYAMLPNYSQSTGLLVLADPTKPGEQSAILAKVAPPQTIGRLTVQQGRLYGGTSEFRGLGLKQSSAPSRPRVVELDPATLHEVRAIELPVDRARNTTGLLTLDDRRLLIGIEGGGLFVIDTQGEQMSARKVGHECVGAGSLVAVREAIAAALCGNRLYAVSADAEALALAVETPPTASFIAAGPDGSVFVTARSEILQVPAAVIAQAESLAKTVTRPSRLISDSELKDYKTDNALLRDESAWISQLSGKAALNASFIGATFETAPEELVAAEITWVSPATTPAKVRIEYSSDGRTWKVAAVRATAKASKASYWSERLEWDSVGSHRYWRLLPESGLKDHFAVDQLALRRSPTAPGAGGSARK